MRWRTGTTSTPAARALIRLGERERARAQLLRAERLAAAHGLAHIREEARQAMRYLGGLTAARPGTRRPEPHRLPGELEMGLHPVPDQRQPVAERVRGHVARIAVSLQGRLLARAAFEVAVARESLPTWRGGPF